MKQNSLDLKRRLVELEREKRVRRACSDLLFWLFNCTKTQDEQDLVNPYKPFPARPYFAHCKAVIDHYDVCAFEKSRTMMMSWFVSAYFAHMCFTRGPVGVVFQSEDEDRAVHDVKNCKVLWEQSEPELQARWPLKKSMDKQPYNKLEMANGSWLLGIPGDPDKIRSSHPTAVVLDEAAFISRGLDSYSTAMATRCLKIVMVSSAEPGWYEDLSNSAKPTDWPEHLLVA